MKKTCKKEKRAETREERKTFAQSHFYFNQVLGGGSSSGPAVE